TISLCSLHVILYLITLTTYLSSVPVFLLLLILASCRLHVFLLFLTCVVRGVGLAALCRLRTPRGCSAGRRARSPSRSSRPVSFAGARARAARPGPPPGARRRARGSPRPPMRRAPRPPGPSP